MQKEVKNNKGFTLIEMIVAVSIFSVVVVVISDMFLSVLSSQRRSIVVQNVQENMRYVFEVMSKELRHAQRSDGECFSGGENRIYNPNNSGNALYFRNKNDECVVYALVDGVLVVRRNTRIANMTPSSLIITGLRFDVEDNDINGTRNPEVQPRVTLKMKAEMELISTDIRDLYMQTTVTSRYYE